jgi:hypothetical protein
MGPPPHTLSSTVSLSPPLNHNSNSIPNHNPIPKPIQNPNPNHNHNHNHNPNHNLNHKSSVSSSSVPSKDTPQLSGFKHPYSFEQALKYGNYSKGGYFHVYDPHRDYSSSHTSKTITTMSDISDSTNSSTSRSFNLDNNNSSSTNSSDRDRSSNSNSSSNSTDSSNPDSNNYSGGNRSSSNITSSSTTSSDSNHNSSCSHYYDQHATMDFGDMVDKYKLWAGFVGAERLRALTPNDTLFGLQHALDVIWAHQHPADCSTARFMIPGEHTGGFGSELHVLTNGLGLAMDLGRVYLPNPFLQRDSQWELETPFCQQQSQSQSRLGLECYYERWSSCTIFDALGPTALEILHKAHSRRYHVASMAVLNIQVKEIPSLYSDQYLAKISQQFKADKVVLLSTLQRLGTKYIPRVFRPLMACSPLIPRFQYYWWRAITMTYFVRPNNETMHWIDAHRNVSFEDSLSTNNVVSVYVRRGDKSREMRIPPFNEYTDTMRLLWALQYLPQTLPRIIFLASESSEVITDMVTFVAQHNDTYQLFYTTAFDRKGLLAEKSAHERDQGIAAVHHPDEYLSMLLNIHHLLQGNGWVCTLGSNFCRVVDELRATVAARAGAPFADLSSEKCGQPPCIFGGFIDMDW